MNAALFWTIATVMVVFATAVIVVPLFWIRRDGDSSAASRRTIGMAAIATALLPLAALGVYSLIGSPALVGSQAPSSAVDIAQVHPGADPLQAGEAAGDLASATARLEAKLAQNPNDAGGWRLLAQSYQFAGRTEDAAAANERATRVAAGETVTPPAASTAPPVAAAAADDAGLEALRARLKNNPRDTEAMVQLAEGLRRKREFPEALSIFAKLAKTSAMTADLWADYADAAGAAQGALDQQSALYIAQALKLDPRHPKALWLMGSYQTEQKDYRGALATWQRLAGVLPADSSDARIIAANMAEARAALGESSASAPSLQAVSAALSAPRAAAVAVRGEISLDARWRNSVAPGSVLFVFAKVAGQPGPPLAVWRTTTGQWPLSFVLDDSSAMIPTRKLSDFRSVVVEARISRSGTADPQRGDLRGTSPTIDPHAAGAIRLVIGEEIG